MKKWTRDYDHATEPLARSLESFRSVIGHDLPQANAFLRQAQITLTEYREAGAPQTVKPPPEAEAPTPERP